MLSDDPLIGFLLLMAGASMKATLPIVVGMLWYLRKNCSVPCERNHAKHRKIKTLLFLFPIWGWWSIPLVFSFVLLHPIYRGLIYLSGNRNSGESGKCLAG